MAPGAGSVECLAVLEPAALSAAGRIDAVLGSRRAQAWLQAREHRLLAAMVDDVEARESLHDPSGHCFLAEEVACAMRVAPSTAEARLQTAVDLVRRLPEALALLEAGEISAAHARLLSDETMSLELGIAAEVSRRVLPRAPEQTYGELKRAIRRVVKTVDSRRAEVRHLDAVATRRVEKYPAEDGMATIWALLPAEGAEMFWAALNHAAKPCGPDDARTADQRRADAFVELGVNARHDPTLGPLPTQPAVNITVGLATLLGDNDQPGELDGYGPIPASMARRIAADPTGTWRRLITDPAGRLLDYGTCTYRPPADLTRHVRARDQHCVIPGCGRRAIHCELDHATPFPAGGTNAANLRPLCKRHHLMKHHSTWRIDQQPDGSFEATTPTRHRWHYRPPPLPTPGTALPAVQSPKIKAAKVVEDPPPF